MKKEILCIGEILFDSMPSGLFLGGAPFNVACHLHYLGGRAALASRIGRGELGKRIMRSLPEIGLTTELIHIDLEHKTGLVNVSLDKEGNATYKIVAPVAWDFIELTDELSSRAKNAEALVFGTLAQRTETTRKTIQTLCRSSTMNVLDVNLRPPYDSTGIIEESLRLAHIIKLNEEEMLTLSARFSLGWKQNDIIEGLAATFDLRMICVTRGKQGALLWADGKWYEHAGFQIEVKDTVGAGDAFLAAFLDGLTAGRALNEVLQFANALGAYVAGCESAIPQHDMGVIRKLINEQGSPHS